MCESQNFISTAQTTEASVRYPRTAVSRDTLSSPGLLSAEHQRLLRRPNSSSLRRVTQRGIKNLDVIDIEF